jgi:uncharacterized protein
MSVEIPAIAPRRAWRTSALGVLLALGFFSLPVGSWIHDDASVANHLGFELIVWAWVAGILLYVSEEILFRGYPIERLEELTGSRAAAGALTCAVFTLDHIGFWGWHHIFIAGSAGALLTLLYLWRRNIWLNMIAHFVVDAAAFLA